MTQHIKGFKKIVETITGWSDWISPTPRRPYQMACCDCGLVHDLQFKAVKVTQEKRGGYWSGEDMDIPYRVLLRARRNERSTQRLRERDKLDANQ